MQVTPEFGSLVFFILTVGGAYTTTLVTFVTLRSEVKQHTSEIKELKIESEERTKMLNDIKESQIRVEEIIKSLNEKLEERLRYVDEKFREHTLDAKTELDSVKKKIEELNISRNR